MEDKEQNSAKKNEKKLEEDQTQKKTTEKPKKQFALPKIALIGLGLLLIFLLLVVGYYMGTNKSSKIQAPAKVTESPTQIPVNNTNAEWKTYTNSKYDYSIDYPGNWYNREFGDPSITGSAFTKSSKSNDYANETISIDINNKTLNDYGIPFETYVKTAATHEIQNYKSLASIKKITTADGIVGYETTWNVQSIGPGGTGTSLPRTYFEIPNNDKATVQIELSKEEDLAVYEKMLTTFKFNGQTQPIQQNQQTLLEVPQFGIKIALSEDIKDAYVVVPKSNPNDYVYLKVHSLDGETQCNSDESSTAAISKVGKDAVSEMSGKKYSDSFNGVTIGNYYYYIDLAQYSCAESEVGKAKLELVRKAFSNASISIKAL